MVNVSSKHQADQMIEVTVTRHRDGHMIWRPGSLVCPWPSALDLLLTVATATAVVAAEGTPVKAKVTVY